MHEPQHDVVARVGQLDREMPRPQALLKDNPFRLNAAGSKPITPVVVLAIVQVYSAELLKSCTSPAAFANVSESRLMLVCSPASG